MPITRPWKIQPAAFSPWRMGLSQTSPLVTGEGSNIVWQVNVTTSGEYISKKLTPGKTYLIWAINGFPKVAASRTEVPGRVAASTQGVTIFTSGSLLLTCFDTGEYGNTYVHINFPSSASAGQVVQIIEVKKELLMTTNNMLLPAVPILDAAAPAIHQAFPLSGTGFAQAVTPTKLIAGKPYRVMVGSGTVRVAFSRVGNLGAGAITTSYVVLGLTADFVWVPFDDGNYGSTYVYATGNASTGAWSLSIVPLA